jgi:hypothetical protein
MTTSHVAIIIIIKMTIVKSIAMTNVLIELHDQIWILVAKCHNHKNHFF